MKDKRDKAFLGALIGGVLGLGSSIASGVMGRKAQKRQLRREQINQNRNDTYEMAQNLTAGYGNQEYVDDFQKKVSFRNGGKIKYGDRIKYNKRFRHGCRSKCKLGWEGNDTSDAIGGALSSIGNVVSSAINSKPVGVVTNTISAPSITKDTIEVPDYAINNDYLQRYKCGGRMKRK